jgi:hypothetical protein
LFELRLTGKVGHYEVALNLASRKEWEILKGCDRTNSRFLELVDFKAFIGAQAASYKEKKKKNHQSDL